MSVPKLQHLDQMQLVNTPLFIQFSNLSDVSQMCEKLHGSRYGKLRYFNPNLFENVELLKSFMFEGGLDGLSNFQDCIGGTLVFENTHLTTIPVQKALRAFIDINEQRGFGIRLVFLSMFSMKLHMHKGLVDLPFYFRIKENEIDI